MAEATSSVEFRNPQEQLRLSSLLNRFCSRVPDEFDPTVHVDEARIIVKELDPVIQLLSSNYSFKRIFGDSSSSRSLQMTGATDSGTTTATIDNRGGRALKEK